MNSQLKAVFTLTSERVGFTHKWSTAVEQWGFRKSGLFVQESLLLPHSFALKFPLLRVIPRGDSNKIHGVFLNQSWVYLPKQSKAILLTRSCQRVLEDALTHLLGLCVASS